MPRVRAAVRGCGAGAEALRLEKLRGKHRIGGFEAYGLRVREIIADNVKSLTVGVETGKTGSKSIHAH